MSGVDYSKWDHFGESSSSEDDECDLCNMDPEALRRLYNSAARSKSKYVSIHPLDDVSTLHPVFLTDPDDFIPRHCPFSDKFENWGIVIEEEDDDDFDDIYPVLKFMKGRIKSQHLYEVLSCSPYTKTPERQFVSKLILNKEKKLASVTKEFLKRDYILKISMDEIKPEIWRRLKVSGGVNLHVLQDKIISPIMGWTRNYHAYCYTDRSDGAVYGPKECDAIDMGWIDHHGYEFMDDKKIQLGLVLQKVGDELGYLYDMGDRWKHTIKVEKILSEHESTGSCVLIGGAMRCPPEDSHGCCGGKGNHFYEMFLDQLPPRKKWKGPWDRSLSRKARESLVEASAAMNCRPYMFDPYEFTLKKAQHELRHALSSTASSRVGSKKMVFPAAGTRGPRNEKPGPGLHIKRDYAGTCKHGPYLQETVNLMRDSKTNSLCSNCGKPNNLQCCSACRMVRYCGRECQRAHWIAGHKQECPRLAKQRKQIKAEVKAEQKHTKTGGSRSY